LDAATEIYQSFSLVMLSKRHVTIEMHFFDCDLLHEGNVVVMMQLFRHIKSKMELENKQSTKYEKFSSKSIFERRQHGPFMKLVLKARILFSSLGPGSINLVFYQVRNEK